MKRRTVAVLAATIAMAAPVTQVSADADRTDFSVRMLVTSVVPGESRTTPNERWVFFEDKYVAADGVASIGTEAYSATLDTTIRGKLSPDGTEGGEWAVFTLSLAGETDVVCDGDFHVRRFVDEHYPDTSPVPYGEEGRFRAECDDGTTAMGDLVGRFGQLDGVPGFVVSLDGTAR